MALHCVSGRLAAAAPAAAAGDVVTPLAVPCCVFLGVLEVLDAVSAIAAEAGGRLAPITL